MAPRRIKVFFYGLFMDAGLLRTKGAHPVNIRPACVPGFALRIGHRTTLGDAPGGRSYGILLELTHAEIEQLYSEASVRAYRAEPVLAELNDGSPFPALCFNLVVPPGPEEANPEYAAKLRNLARQLVLPSDYVVSNETDETTERESRLRCANFQAAFLSCFARTFAHRARCAAAILARAAAESLRRGLRARLSEALLRPLLLPPT
jgi:hypothetical protein